MSYLYSTISYAYSSMNNLFHNTREYVFTNKEFVTCFYCKQEIDNNLDNNGYYHLNCFAVFSEQKCVKCQKDLKKYQTHLHQSKAYCTKCLSTGAAKRELAKEFNMTNSSKMPSKLIEEASIESLDKILQITIIQQ